MSNYNEKKRNHTSDSSFETTERQSKTKTHSKPESKKAKSAETKVVEASGQISMNKFTSKMSTTSFDSLSQQLREIYEGQDKIAKQLDMCITQNDFKTYIEKVKLEIVESINVKVEKLEGRIFELEVNQEKLQSTNNELKKQIETLTGQVKSAEACANIALVRTNNLEQYTRKNSIRIFGVSDTNKEESVPDTISKSLDVLKKIGMSVTQADISVAHRLGFYKEEKPRPVIVKFVRRVHKIESIQKRRKLKGSRVVITEDLTKDNYSFLQKVKEHTNVESAWTRDGTTFAKLRSNGRVVKVLCMRDVSNN